LSLLHDRPETEYADTGEGQVAYQQFGTGPPDLIYMTSIESHAEMIWDHPTPAHYFERLASFSRVLYFDIRGGGASDPVPLGRPPTVENWTDDARVVMDAAEVEQATVVAEVEGGFFGMTFAAMHPERTSGLVLINTFPRLLRAGDYPIGVPEHLFDAGAQRARELWGRPGYFDHMLPSRKDDSELKEWLARYQRVAATPNTALAIYENFGKRVDLRSILASIKVPTLVICRKDATWHRPDHSRYLADHIPDARLVELPGADTHPTFAADPEPVLDEIEEFVTGVRSTPVTDRTLATVMFTDIVDSTRHTARLGDHEWLDILERHQRITRDYLDRYRGREVKSTGDGILATFDGPTRAVTCAASIRSTSQAMGIDMRVGLHTGEIEFSDGDIGGMAVNIASRVMDANAGGGIAASSTVRDLVVGSGIEFKLIGLRELKGVPGEWALFEVVAVP
jgi:class 3 adenylate cyclase